jgi:hypothetical protein
MRKTIPCAVCGSPSKNFLFKDKTLGVAICSKKCEHEYLKELSPGATEHTNVVQYLDYRITEYKKRNKIGWGVSGVGVLLWLPAFLIPDVNAFIAGTIIAALGALATRHYEDTIRKLTIQRKKLVI